MSKTQEFAVEGMGCAHCIKAVKEALGSLPGVTGVSVDLDAGTVTVEYSPDEVSPQDMARSLDEAGYSMTV